MAMWQIGAQEPTWKRWQAQIERHPFRDGVHDVLHFTHHAQQEAWEKLASIEDEPKVDEYLHTLAPPDMVYIPAGGILQGWTDEEAQEIVAEARGEIGRKLRRRRIEDALGQHEVWLCGYYMSRYPVTNEQYRAFMEAGGYRKAEYWREAEAQERWEGGVHYSAYGDSEAPDWWYDPDLNGAQQPVVGVTWYEALAYCRWAGMDLPTEAQWEKAAGWHATEKRMRRHPWGDEYKESDIYDIDDWSPPVLGIYDAKLNFYGLADMAGLDHWCRSKYQPYPYREDDGREELTGSSPRVVRGGSNPTFVLLHCRYRFWHHPHESYPFIGFRTVSCPRILRGAADK